MMQVISAKAAQQNLETLCEQVYQNHEPYIINRENHHNIVILSLDDYNSWTETNYLLSNPYNAERLLNSLKKARAGEVFERELIEE
jgi:antitoxin YefM